MSKTVLTKKIESALWSATHKMGVFGCFEVTFGWLGKERVDYITYDTKDVFRCYEIKVSKSDFNSLAAISFLGNFNYYVMPFDLYSEVCASIPETVGVYLYSENSNGFSYLESVKKAKRQEIEAEDKEMLKNSLIRSLSREQAKVVEEKIPLKLQYEKEQKKALENDLIKTKQAYNDLLSFVYNRFGYDWQYDFNEYLHTTSIKNRKEKQHSQLLEGFEKRSKLRKEGVFSDDDEGWKIRYNAETHFI